MADKLPNIPPPSKPFPGSLTPGWNDPPVVNNESRSHGRPKLYLNKRVAYPVQGTLPGNCLEDSSKSQEFVYFKTLQMGSVPPSHNMKSVFSGPPQDASECKSST